MTSRSFWPIASWIESPGFQRRSICQQHGSVFFVNVRLAPLGRRQQARLPPGRRRSRSPAEAEPARPALERVAAVGGQRVEAVAEVVEVRVAGVRERRRQRHRLVDVRVPVLEDLRRRDGPPAAVYVPCTGASGTARSMPLLHRRQRGHRLERRAGRIEALDRAVERRVVVPPSRSSGSRTALRASSASARPTKTLGLNVGVDAMREDRAVVRVHRDDRAAVRGPVPSSCVREADAVVERPLGRPLERDVDRQPDGVARLRRRLRLDRLAARARRASRRAAAPRPARPRRYLS